jgi:hypothetical protein
LNVADGADVTANNKAKAIDRPDTRDTNEPPSYYYALGRGTYSEFKRRTTIGAPGSGMYVSLLIDVPWGDASGGPVIQQCSPGDNIYRRKSLDTATWGTWYKIADGADVTGANTALDTSLVNGTSASTVKAYAINGNTAKGYTDAWKYGSTTYINGGNIYAGSKIVVGNDNIILDGDPNGAGTPGSGSIIIAPDGGPTNQSYCELQDGDLSFYKVFSDGLQYKYKSVVSIDSGECVNGQTIQLNGRWKERPYVQVAPAELMSYDKSYSTYSQTLSCPAPTPWESPIGSGKWYIKPRAVLKMSPNVTTVGYSCAVEKEYTPPETEGARGPYWSGWHSLGSYSFQRDYAYKYVINLTASHRIEVIRYNNFEGACLHLQYSYDNATWVDLFYYNSGPPYHNSFRTWSQNYNLTKTGPVSHTMMIYFRGRGIRNWSGSGTSCRWLMKIATNNIEVYTTTYDTGAIDGTLTYLAIGK